MTYNLTPRKRLGHTTPIQALFKDLERDVTLRDAYSCCTSRCNSGGSL